MKLPAHLAYLELVENEPSLLESASALFCPAGCHRYALTRLWGTGPVVVFVMLNPSTADAFRLDPTVTRCRARAERAGAGGLLVLNAYGLRATDPTELRRHSDPVGADNDAVIRWLLADGGPLPVGPVIVGWGSDATLRRDRRDQRMLDLIGGLGHRPMCLKRTAGGYPQHPLYVSYRDQPHEYTGTSCPDSTERVKS
jgi:hypothetical protein